jgi:2'-5' RNA ligase
MLKTSKRVFVGIKMTDDVAGECTNLRSRVGEVQGSWVSLHDVHLTLIPPWRTTDIGIVIQRIEDSVRVAHSFYLELHKLTYGPSARNKRYLWIECSSSSELTALRSSLIEALQGTDGIAPNDNEHGGALGAHSTRRFLPHVTIARLKGVDEHRRNAGNISIPLFIKMPVSSVQLFESLQEGSVKYAVLHSAKFPS